MRRLGRLSFLIRLSKRYALRHRGQTLRAILGLLVVGAVLMSGLGLGESIGGSLEGAALARFGPVDVTVRSYRPFDESLVENLSRAPGAREHGSRGAPSIAVTGVVAHPRAELAEAFAVIRGVGAGEARALGPLRGLNGETVPDPRSGEVVLSASLAKRLEARVGDTLMLRAPPPGAFPDARVESVNFTGVTGTPLHEVVPHVVTVEEGAIGLFSAAEWADAAPTGSLTLTVRSPGGREFANTSRAAPVTLFVPAPLEEGPWSVVVSSPSPSPYLGTVGAAYPPASLTPGAAVLEARVSGIAASEGRAALGWRPVALLPLDDLQEAYGLPRQATEAHYRVAGNASAVAEAMERALPAEDRERFRVTAVKTEALEEAREAGREITGFLLVMGGFTLLAAALLAYALFSALVEERRSELGIARALGLTRGEVAFSMTIEGALYAAGAAAVGVALGVGLLNVFIHGLNRVIAREGGPAMAVHVGAETLILAFLVGVAIPLVTIGFASLRFARLDPARAIRNIPDDPRAKRRGGFYLAAGLVLAGALLSTGPVGRLLGVPLLLAGAAIALNAWGRRWIALAAALAGVAHVAWTLYTFKDFPRGADEVDPILTMARGALLALGLSALAVASPGPYRWLGAQLARREGARRPGFVALRYLVSRRTAVGLTMGMISLVVVVITVMGALFLVYDGQIPEDVGGYAVLGETSVRLDGWPAPLPAEAAGDIDRAEFLHRHFEFRAPNVTRNGEPVAREDEDWAFRSFIGVTDGFAEDNAYEMANRAPRYATDGDAWRAVARGEAIVLPAWMFSEFRLEPGDEIVIETALLPPRSFVLAGGVRGNTQFGGNYIDQDIVDEMGFPTSTLVFVRPAEGADPDKLAHRLTAHYAVESGVTFVSVREEAAAVASTVRAFILVFEAFLALGLFVGLAATSFLASRAVHERMRDIGTLRALGYEPKDVRRAFMLESTATAGVGLFVGAAAGILVAHSVWWREIRAEGIPFSLPLVIMAGFAASVLALAALAARGPAKRAAALPPALAVRHVE